MRCNRAEDSLEQVARKMETRGERDGSAYKAPPSRGSHPQAWIRLKCLQRGRCASLSKGEQKTDKPSSDGIAQTNCQIDEETHACLDKEAWSSLLRPWIEARQPHDP